MLSGALSELTWPAILSKRHIFRYSSYENPIPFVFLFINILIAEVYAIIFGLLTFACINLMDFLFSIFSQLL